MITLKNAAIALAAISTITAVSAAPIDGAVSYAGLALLDSGVSASATQVIVAAGNINAAVGDLASLLNDPVNATSPLIFGTTTGDIWTSGIFSFSTAGTVSAFAGPNNTLAVVASGVLDDGPGGFDATPATFVMAITPTASGVGAFGSITITTVPDAGSSLMLLGLGLAAVGVRRRMVA